MSLVEELMQAALAAGDDRKKVALRVLRGEPVEAAAKQVTGPLLMGVGAGAKFVGVSRATLWRACLAGRIQKVELFPGSYRVRREDLEALAAGRTVGTRTNTDRTDTAERRSTRRGRRQIGGADGE